jgi:hypothetical protein
MNHKMENTIDYDKINRFYKGEQDEYFGDESDSYVCKRMFNFEG